MQPLLKIGWGRRKKLRLTQLLVMDCDGTLTNGLLPNIQFNVKDGYGLTHLNITTAIISGRLCSQITERANNLGIDYVFTGENDKLVILQNLAISLGIDRENICYIGDDVNDLDCIVWSGFGVAVHDAVPEVKRAADYVTKATGGHGAVRELCDMIERARR